jgi:hypothetical protein
MHGKSGRLTGAGIASAMLLAGVLMTPARAAASEGERREVEGTWVVKVTPESGPIPAFTALETYGAGGGFVTSNDLAPTPVPRPGQGVWRRTGPGRYGIEILFFVFGPDGARAGTIEVRHEITVDGDSYTGRGTAEMRDAAGELAATIPFESEGGRMEVR